MIHGLYDIKRTVLIKNLLLNLAQNIAMHMFIFSSHKYITVIKLEPMLTHIAGAGDDGCIRWATWAASRGPNNLTQPIFTLIT